jgi:hypothetical protein
MGLRELCRRSRMESRVNAVGYGALAFIFLMLALGVFHMRRGY